MNEAVTTRQRNPQEFLADAMQLRALLRTNIQHGVESIYIRTTPVGAVVRYGELMHISSLAGYAGGYVECAGALAATQQALVDVATNVSELQQQVVEAGSWKRKSLLQRIWYAITVNDRLNDTE